MWEHNMLTLQKTKTNRASKQDKQELNIILETYNTLFTFYFN